MRIIVESHELAGFMEKLRVRGAGADPAVEKTTRTIIADVIRSGDRAVLKYTRAFDDRTARTLGLSRDEIARYAAKADPRVVRALKTAATRIRRFHRRQTERTWTYRDRDALLGQSIRPLRRVGVYVPGGTASYPSSVLMNVIPAQVAGVKEIAVCVPIPGGKVNPHVMAALLMLGVTEVYRIGGAQAVAALAYGTSTIARVDKIVGPGNIYVATAKKLVFGAVDIDMIAGPSEILIIGDRTADPSFIAADLLSQAEHDALASSVLITNSRTLANRVSAEVERQLAGLSRKEIARRALRAYGAIIVVRDLSEAVSRSNDIAPEHLEIMTERPMDLLPHVENAGAIFLGPWTPEALGDYAAGPNHTLPTGGTARFFSPLGVYDFYKRSSLVRFGGRGFHALAATVETIADTEGLEAHANSVRVRAEAQKKQMPQTRRGNR